jgi:hypothetical protein
MDFAHERVIATERDIAPEAPLRKCDDMAAPRVIA